MPRSRPRPAWRVIAWMCAAHVLAMTPFSVYPALLPRLQAEWGMSNSEAGLVSGLFFAGYMCAVPVLTSLTDRIDARYVYFVSSLFAAASTFGFGWLAQGSASAGLAQVICGASVAGTYMPGLKALTDNTSGHAQARAVSFYTAFFGAGISLSIALAGWSADALGWRAAFMLAALGPPVAACMVLFGLPPRTVPARARATALLDFRAILRDRKLNGFVFGYAVHCWELFGSRAWLVAFLSHAQSVSTAAWPLAPAAMAAIANLAGPIGSIGGNELAMRRGRLKIIRAGMLISALLTATLGFMSALPWLALLALAVLHMALVMSDSSALTAGLVATVDPHLRGTAMAVHSTFGFAAGFIAPLVFGAVLDAASYAAPALGASASGLAWACAFVSLAIGGIVAAFRLRWSGAN